MVFDESHLPGARKIEKHEHMSGYSTLSSQLITMYAPGVISSLPDIKNHPVIFEFWTQIDVQVGHYSF